jgi:hypothetical protein
LPLSTIVDKQEVTHGATIPSSGYLGTSRDSGEGGFYPKMRAATFSAASVCMPLMTCW